MFFAAMHRTHGLKVRRATSYANALHAETVNASGIPPMWIQRINPRDWPECIALKHMGWTGSADALRKHLRQRS